MASQNFVTRPGSQFIQSATSAVERTVTDKLIDIVSVLDFIPESEHEAIRAKTSTYDCLSAIQAAVDTGATAVVPEGLFNVSGTINVASNRHLHLLGGATISKATGTTQPVVRVYGNYATLTGSGFTSLIQTTDVSGANPTQPWTEGIVHVGMFDGTTPVNTNWVIVEKLRISGSSARWSAYNSSAGVDNAIESDIGIKMANPDNFLVGSNSLYFTTVRDIHFSLLGICVDMTPVVQGNFFYNLHAYRCTYAGFNITGCNENSIFGTFFHSCPGITYLRMQKSLSAAEATAAGYSYYGYPDRACQENLISHLMGEPGTDGPQGRDSQVYNLADTSVSNNYIHGQQNTGHSNTNNATPLANSIYLENSYSIGSLNTNTLSAAEAITSNGGSSQFGLLVMTPPESTLWAYGHRFLRIGLYTFAAGDRKDIATFSIPSTSGAAKIRVKAVHGWTSSSTSSWGTDELVFELFRGNSSTVTIRNCDSEKGTTTGFCEVIVSGTTATVAYYSQHDTNVRFYCELFSGRLNSDTDNIITVVALDGSTTSTANILPAGKAQLRSLLAYPDNTLTLGNASNRWSEVFAGNGTINTSDVNLKEDIRSLSAKETAVAASIKQLIRAYRFKDAVIKKGDAARIHVGVIAQDVEQAFVAEGLDPARYGLFCRDTWYDLDGTRVDVEPDEEPPTGAVLVERLGIRYDELLAFVVAAF